MPQTAEEIENEKEEKNKEYIKTAMQYYAKETKNLSSIENGEKRKILIKATGVNNGMIDNNKITFEDWYVDDKFENNNNIKISEESKAYINDLIKRTIEDKKIEIDYQNLTTEEGLNEYQVDKKITTKN